MAAALAIVAVFLSVLGVMMLRSSVDSTRGRPEPGTGVATALAGATRAEAPFAGLTEAHLALGDRCLRVAIADMPGERQQGLRGITNLDDYDGMLFVYAANTDAQFTMAGTPLPLDIGWYAADGSLVDRTTMQPCREGNDTDCPLYASKGPFRYVLETQAGHGSAAPIGACTG
jgi:uncharacterized membrane protein (UPF0127 family)